MPSLIVVQGPHKILGHMMPKDRCVIGRGLTGTHHLSLDRDTAISRHLPENDQEGHAVVEKTDEGWLLTDLESEFGTYIEDRGAMVPLARGTSAALRDKQAFKCGESVIVFWEGEIRPDEDEKEAMARRAAGIRMSTSTDHLPTGSAVSTTFGQAIQ
jgi:hypothetical protein